MLKIDTLIWCLNVVELIACITGFIYWQKIKDGYWKWFPFYLLLIVMIEMSGKILISVYHDLALNTAVYRYFGIPVQFLFFFWVFYSYFSATSNQDKKWPYIGTALYILSWAVERFFFQKLRSGFGVFSYNIGNIVLLVLIILFFIRFINSEAILKYKKSMMFWVCLGLLSFYLLTMPFYAIRLTLYRNYRSVFDVYSYVSVVLDIVMYLFFIAAFKWGRPK